MLIPVTREWGPGYMPTVGREVKGSENRRRYLSKDGKDAMASINNEFK